jgi:ABC-type phosphate transport system substrate-binding protein
MTKLIFIALFLFALAVPSFAAEGYQVIVNANNPVTSISKATLRNYFLGKSTRWPDGTAVKPIDLSESSEVRAQFSKRVLGKQTAAVKSYWLSLIFAGRGTPPVQLESDEKVLAAVRASPAAIAYISPASPLGSSVKSIPVTD